MNYETTIVKGMSAGKVPLLYKITSAIKSAVIATTTSLPIPIADRADGVDTSFWEGVMNFGKNPALKFACIKATQGYTIFDNQYINSRNNLISLGIPWHSFHFLTTSDALIQANWYLNHIIDSPGPMPPVVDVELLSVSAKLIRTVVQRIYDMLAVWPIIYTSKYYWGLVYEEAGRTDKQWIADRCKLWVAHYGTTTPAVPSNWNGIYMIHQYSSSGDGYAWGAQSKEIDLDWSRISWLAQFQVTPPPVIKTINTRGYTVNIRNAPVIDPNTDIGDAKLTAAEVIEDIPDWYVFKAYIAKSVSSLNP